MLTVTLALAALTYSTDIKPVLDTHCVPCHSAVFDLSEFPFTGSSWPTQEETVQHMIERMRRGNSDGRMPPASEEQDPLPDAKVALFDAWLAGGLQP